MLPELEFRRVLFRSRVFVFKAEDGIRDATVTGVQTCALPISTWIVSVAFPVFQRIQENEACPPRVRSADNPSRSISWIAVPGVSGESPGAEACRFALASSTGG